MASPQIEQGFVPIANELFDAMCRAGLNGSEWTVFMAVIRITYGWRRKEGEVSLGAVTDITGENKGTTSRAIASLIAKNMLTETAPATWKAPRRLSVNKDYEAWKTRGLKNETVSKMQESQIGNSLKNSDATVSKMQPLYTYKEQTEEGNSAFLDGSGILILTDIGTQHEISQAKVDRWKAIFTTINVSASLRKFATWVEELEPAKRPKPDSADSRARKWLEREVEYSKQNNGSPLTPDPENRYKPL